MKLKSFFLLAFAFLAIQLPVFAQILPDGLKNDRRDKNDEQNDLIDPKLAPFYHGVASGDPLPTQVIIWTRVTPQDTSQAPISVNYVVATDLALTQVIKSGTLQAVYERDFCVKYDVTGLSANTYYYYQFEALGKKSIVGRTKTAPDGALDNVKIGVLSCSDYRDGYFNAYGKLAERNDIDLMVHTGDYIYEGGGGGHAPGRVHNPNFEMYRLQDYRTRFSLYRLDPDLRWAHQVYPWVTIWDDHDIVVDALRDTSYRHNAAKFGPYYKRKHAAIQAAREWLPMRDPVGVDSNFYKNWRKIGYGSLLDLISIDCRLYDRDRFAVDNNDTIFGKPDHKILGPEQLDWLNTELRNSSAKWKVINNGLMLSQLMILGTPLIYENWDGYPVERGKLLSNLKDNLIDNVVVVTGDFHCSFANDVSIDPNDTLIYNPATGDGSLAVEFIAPSICAGNFDEGDNYGLPSPQNAQDLIRSVSPHNRFVDVTHHGYILLDLTPQRAQAEFWFMDDILNRYNRSEKLAAVWITRDGRNRLEQGAEPSPAKPVQPAAPEAPTFLAVEPLKNASPITLSLAPNPTEDFTYLNLVLPSAAKLQISIINAQGKTVENVADSKLTQGNYVFPVDLTSLPVGVYLLSVRSEKEIWVKRVVKN